MNESTLRDFIASHLELLEEGLILRGTETHLPNLEGSAGRMDIYARDRFGHHVVIEIKSSDKAAREALHEMEKYASLLKRSYGLQDRDLRFILVSTAWRELRIPFSAFIKKFPFPVSGYQATFGPDGKLRLDEVQLPPSEEPIEWFEIQRALFFSTTGRRTLFIETALPRLAALRDYSIDFVLIPFDYAGDSPIIVYPFCLYLAWTKPSPTEEKDLVLFLASHSPQAGDDEEPPPTVVEEIELFLLRSLSELYDEYRPRGPEGLTNLLSEWTPQPSIRVGDRVSDKRIYEDTDLLAAFSSNQGRHRFLFEVNASPRFNKRWSEMKAQLRRFLQRNKPWQILVLNFLERQQSHQGIIVEGYIYLPAGMLATLYQKQKRLLRPEVPQASLVVKNNQGDLVAMLTGQLAWNGKPAQGSPASLLAPALHSWGISYNWLLTLSFAMSNQAASFDSELCQVYGLEFIVCEAELRGQEILSLRTGVLNAGVPSYFTATDLILHPLDQFIHEYKEHFTELARDIDAVYFNLSAGPTQEDPP